MATIEEVIVEIAACLGRVEKITTGLREAVSMLNENQKVIVKRLEALENKIK
jgi:hypothetical protein